MARATRDAWAEPGSYVLVAPAALYAMQNNLQYVAASNLEPAVFQLLYQGKILTTAFFSVALLKRRLERTQWLAIALLASGLAAVGASTASPAASAAKDVNVVVGGLAVFAACCSSGFSSVYFERVVKARAAPAERSPNRGPPARRPISVWARNAQMATFSSAIAVAGAFAKDGAYENPGPEKGGLRRTRNSSVERSYVSKEASIRRNPEERWSLVQGCAEMS